MKIDKGLDGRGIYRAIYCSIWDDVDFRKLTSDEKLVFLNLRTSPLTNMPAIYPYYVEAIEKQTGLDQDRILKSLKTLCSTNWIVIEEGIVWIKKGLKFDPSIVLTNEKHMTAIKNIILSLPKLQIVKDFVDFYRIPIPYAIPHTIGYIPKNSMWNIQDPDPDPDPEPEKEPEKEKEEEYEEKEKQTKVNPLFLSKEEDQPQPQIQNPQTISGIVSSLAKKKRLPFRSEEWLRREEFERNRERLQKQAREMVVK